MFAFCHSLTDDWHWMKEQQVKIKTEDGWINDSVSDQVSNLFGIIWRSPHAAMPSLFLPKMLKRLHRKVAHGTRPELLHLSRVSRGNLPASPISPTVSVEHTVSKQLYHDGPCQLPDRGCQGEGRGRRERRSLLSLLQTNTLPQRGWALLSWLLPSILWSMHAGTV